MTCLLVKTQARFTEILYLQMKCEQKARIVQSYPAAVNVGTNLLHASRLIHFSHSDRIKSTDASQQSGYLVSSHVTSAVYNIDICL